MDIDELARKVIAYLRNNNVLKGKPAFENRTSELVCVDPRGYWDEYYGVYPYWQQKEIETHQKDFEEIDSQLRRLDFDQLQEQALNEIPDSGNTAIIELGSEYGEKGAGYLAKYKPSAKVILISKKWKETKPFEFLFTESNRIKHKLAFNAGKHLLNEQDLEKRINGLYRINGINNVTFHEHELALSETDNLPDFLNNLYEKDIYFFGHMAPTILPFLMGRLYNSLNAKYMCVSLTAVEKIKPEEFVWNIVQRNLNLSDEELKGYIESAHDPIAANNPGSLSDKYDYDNPEQERIGVMIKLGIALALAKEVNGEVLRNNNPEFRIGYNKIDHYVEARR